MANAEVVVVGFDELELVCELYNQIFRPAHDVQFFRRRFLGRHNPLILVANMEKRPVGFATGFELKPDTFFSWLIGVNPDCRRMGIASQLMEAQCAWAAEHNYHLIRMECYNSHRPILHMVIDHGFDFVGIRWDQDRAQNLLISEKSLHE